MSDPFMGGGTSLVEALALGRQPIGVDISSLAEFVSSVKTALLNEQDLSRLSACASRMADAIDMRLPRAQSTESGNTPDCKHLRHPTRWRLRKAITQALSTAHDVRPKRLQPFARCVVLRTAQWALDGRKTLPSVESFRQHLVANAELMIEGARDLRLAAQSNGACYEARCLNRSVIGVETDPLFQTVNRPRLVLTSPPYPGVHVLYHRWQVDGRKETPAPFWIANKLDGAGSSFYTMGDRKYPGLRTYFDNLRSAMSSRYVALRR